MSQQLRNLTVAAPAFFGLNTEESPVGMSPNFASVADNCVIDNRGRIGARKGYIVYLLTVVLCLVVAVVLKVCLSLLLLMVQ
jgi:hypothetical protein